MAVGGPAEVANEGLFAGMGVKVVAECLLRRVGFAAFDAFVLFKLQMDDVDVSLQVEFGAEVSATLRVLAEVSE